MSRIKILILVIILIISYCFFSYKSGINSPVNTEGEEVVFLVSTGESIDEISANLFESDLINSKFYFKLFTKLNDMQTKLQAGEYILDKNMTIKNIVEKLAVGQTISEETEIKIIEGWNLRDVSQYLEREGMFQSEELLELLGFPKIDYRYNNELPKPKNYSAEFSFLADKPDYYGLEGYLFPDTYRIFKNASLEDIIEKMFNNLDKKLTEDMRTDIANQGKTIYEIITMASIIEKEVRSEDDMRTVSGVFWNRINSGQPLESCATLAYILGVNKDIYSLEDTKINSLYNTYKNQGLPPGPICNPGIQAITAAIYPNETNYYYFLSRSDTGETVFSRTYEEHLANKARYLK